MFNNLAPEQEPKVHFLSHDDLVNICPALQVDNDEKAVLGRTSQEGIVQDKEKCLESHIGYFQGIPGPLFETKTETTRRITEFAITAFVQPHRSKRHTFSTLYIQDDTAQNLCLGLCIKGNEEQNEEAYIRQTFFQCRHTSKILQ